MLGIDTNILVRYLTADDSSQLARVDELVDQAIADKERLYFSSVVLCETAWVLKSVYNYSKDEIAEAITQIVDTRQFSIEHRELVRQALQDYRKGKGGFSDHLIGQLHKAAGCRHSVTFDRALASSPQFRVLR